MVVVKCGSALYIYIYKAILEMVVCIPCRSGRLNSSSWPRLRSSELEYPQVERKWCVFGVAVGVAAFALPGLENLC